jgi:hypothetical protein
LGAIEEVNYKVMMKKILLGILLTFITFVVLIIYLALKYPSIDYLPEKYGLSKTNSFLLYTKKFYEYEIDQPVNIDDIKEYPKSKELIEQSGYDVEKWYPITESERDRVTEYMKKLLYNHEDKKDVILTIIDDMNNNIDNFLFAVIGINYYDKNHNKRIDLSYFFIIDQSKRKLYSFKKQPNM